MGIRYVTIYYNNYNSYITIMTGTFTCLCAPLYPSLLTRSDSDSRLPHGRRAQGDAGQQGQQRQHRGDGHLSAVSRLSSRASVGVAPQDPSY